MAGHRLEGAADAVILRFVVAADNPYLTLVFDADLGRSDDMTCRVEADFDPVDGDGFAPFQRLVQVVAQAELQQGQGQLMAEIVFAASPGVVAMGMGDDGFVYGPPGVDVEGALRAIEAMVCEFDERHGCDNANNKPGRGRFGSALIANYQSNFIFFDVILYINYANKISKSLFG